MRHCAIGSRSGCSRRRGDRGAALLSALIVMALVAAMGLGLALTTGLEPLAAANYEAGRSAGLSAEAGISVAIHELAGIDDWNLVLAGLSGSAILDQNSIEVDLPDGSRAGLAELTARATCGPTGSCTDADRSAFTVARPWGPNNPQWRVFGHIRLDRLVPDGTGLPPTEVVVWVADDPAEVDGDPLHDSGTGDDGEPRLGGCALAVRAEAFGPRFAHRTIEAVVARPAPGCGPGARLVSWRILS